METLVLDGLKETLEACQQFIALEGTMAPQLYPESREKTRLELLALIRKALGKLCGEPQQFMTPEQVAGKLQLGIETVYRWLRSGKLLGHRIGRKVWRVSESDLYVFVEGHMNVPKKVERVN